MTLIHLLPDFAIEKHFIHTNFGSHINGNPTEQRNYMLEKLQQKVSGQWVGFTIYWIIVDAGLLVDGKKPALTNMGMLALTMHKATKKDI